MAAQAKDFTVAERIQSYKDQNATCQDGDYAEIVTSVKVINGKEAKKISGGQANFKNNGNILLVNSKNKERKDYSLTPLDNTVAKTADFKPLIGTPACISAGDD